MTLQLSEAIPSLPVGLTSIGFDLDENHLRANLTYDPQLQRMDDILKTLAENPLPLKDMSIAAPNLEDIFLAYTRIH
jgi:hypothetical protein